VKSNRGLLVLGVLAFVLMLAAASPAFARSTTRLSNSVSVDAVSYRGTATLTYLRSGHYIALSGGYVKTYRYSGGRWVYRSQSKTNSKGAVTVTLPSGYRYRLFYAGSSSKKPDWSTTLAVKYIRAATKVSSTGAVYTPSTETTVAVSGTLAYASGGVLAGSLTIARKQPDGSYATFKTATADSHGTWTTDLPVGTYVATYAGDSKRGTCQCFFTVAYTNINPDLATREPSYSLVSGTTTTVGGWFLNGADSSPLGGIMLTISRKQADGTYSAFTSANPDVLGNWSLDLPVGEYRVTSAETPDVTLGGVHYFLHGAVALVSVTGILAPTQVLSTRGEYLLRASNETTAVSGLLSTNSGGGWVPFGGAMLTISRLQGNGTYSVFTTTGSDWLGGAWAVSLPLGEYKVDYLGDGSHHSSSTTLKVTYVAIPTGVWTDQVYSPSASTTTQTVTGSLVANPTPTGNTAVSGAVLTVAWRDGTHAVSTTTNASGKWTVSNLALGDYTVTFAGDSNRSGCSYDFTVASALGSTLLTTTQSEYTAAHLGVDEIASVWGSLTTDFGTKTQWVPLGGVRLNVWKKQQDGSYAYFAGMYTSMDYSSVYAKGGWNMFLDPGDYRVTLDAKPQFTAWSGYVGNYNMSGCVCYFKVLPAPAQ
jgi:hypothetical protein